MLIWLGYLIILLVTFFSLTGLLQTVIAMPLNLVAGLTKQPQLAHLNAFIGGGVRGWLLLGSGLLFFLKLCLCQLFLRVSLAWGHPSS